MNRMRRTGFQAVLLGLGAFGVYLATLAPGVTFGDGPELTTAACQLGVPHPTGYPLYMLLGHAFIRLVPAGSPASRMNLLSAVCAAAAVALLYLLAVRIARNRPAAAAGTLLFAFGLTFWSQAVAAEVYALHVLLMTAVLLCAVEWDRRGDARWLRGAAAVWGVAFAHHLSSVLLAPALLYWLATSRRPGRWRELLRAIPLVLLPLLLYLYLPWAALRDPAMNWGDPRTWERFWAHVTGAQYHGRIGMDSPADLWRRLAAFALPPSGHDNPGYLLTEFGPAIAWLAPVGAWSLWRRRRRWLGFTLLAWLSVVGWGLAYNIPDVDVYFLMAHAMFAVWVAVGLRTVWAWARRVWRRRAPSPLARRAARPVLAAMAGLVVLAVLAGGWEGSSRRGDSAPARLAAATLGFPRPNAVIIGLGDNVVFPALYAHCVEGRRPDLVLVFLRDLLYRDRVRMVQRLAKRGLVVRVPPAYLATPRVTRDTALLRQFVADNLARRPIYFLGCDEEMLRDLRDQKRAIPDFAWVRGAMVPLAQVVAHEAHGH